MRGFIAVERLSKKRKVPGGNEDLSYEEACVEILMLRCAMLFDFWFAVAFVGLLSLP